MGGANMLVGEESASARLPSQGVHACTVYGALLRGSVEDLYGQCVRGVWAGGLSYSPLCVVMRNQKVPQQLSIEISRCED